MHGHRADRRADPLNHFRHASGRQEEEVDEEVENQQETNKKPKQKPQELVAQMR